MKSKLIVAIVMVVAVSFGVISAYGGKGKSPTFPSTPSTPSTPTIELKRPSLRPMIPGWLTVSAGVEGTCAIGGDGGLWCWGNNVATRDWRDAYRPVRIGTENNWAKLHVALPRTCAIKTDGSLWCWRDLRSMTEYDDSEDFAPRQVGTDTDWDMFIVNLHSCGIKKDKTLWCQGPNEYGQIGIGTTSSGEGLQQVGSDSNWVSVNVGFEHTCGLKSDGRVFCWGRNEYGQVGDGTTNESRSSPTAVEGNDWVFLAGHGYHNLAIKRNGTLWCWGDCGFPSRRSWLPNAVLPTQLGTDSNWLFADARNGYSCGIKTDNTLFCWGNGYGGRLGNGTTDSHPVDPTPVRGGDNYKAVSTGSSHTCGIKKDNTLWCWGANTGGAVGNNTFGQYIMEPVNILKP